ncbi:T9SS type A sorting domain-containing protein [Dyadobacter sp. CY312]|uniref:T9SS type A sorting domain-containing protein n=1 Tax=Dyadobacter sp. CY312 TaxID=2907303 RepID=UPI001F39C0ED|nr:T9SS type A sorting domain-containing protein [Dyadobacter sp. CY312]MCE7044217.1 T9SS type A sorting domain-containing protein [Dyadobacter sp. CY312]
MNNLYNYLSAIKRCGYALALVGLASVARAQQGSSGNTTIFGGAQMTFFGDHNFSTGGGGTQPGVINTIRTSPMGVLNFGPSANVVTGADDANYVDGYVRKLGTTPFVFPVGDNSHYGPFAASGDGTTGAYFFVDASTAITSMLPSGNYPVLPAGGPFATTTLDPVLDIVSSIEYWDIDGSSATPITLTWDAGSAVATLTGSQLNKLTIAGWDGSQWVAIPSVVDATSILGGASDLTAGSLTSNAAITPDTYTAYTLASLVNPLPVKLLSFTSRPEGNTASLNWVTTSETNSDRFEIERSGNGKSFVKIGTLESYKESSELKNYSFIDKFPLQGENLYRLKMVDLDGTFAYSSIRQVIFGKSSALVYPNPVSEKLNINNYGQVKQVEIYDSSGRKVLSVEQVSAQGIDLTRLNPGIHTVKITQFDNASATSKIIVIK